MPHKFINEINPGEIVDDVFMVKSPILRTTSRGDFYIAMYLLDKTGQVNSRMWQATEAAYKSIPQPGFLHIKGRSELYKNNLQIVVNNFGVIDRSKVNIADFLPRTERNIKEMFKELKQILSEIENTQLAKIIAEFTNDKPLMDKFCKAPAAIKMHHNYLGGLLEHTLTTMKTAKAIFGIYPNVQPDLVLAGLFLHDLGKTQELSFDMAFEYTDSGQLIGHITQTVIMLEKKVDNLRKNGEHIEQNIVDALSHIILSHHGQYEFGSPKLPATPEAFMVSYLDDMDAKLFQVDKAIDDEDDENNWTQWHRGLQRRIYRKNPEITEQNEQ
jgi:3'-5' exoribonuclease